MSAFFLIMKGGSLLIQSFASFDYFTAETSFHMMPTICQKWLIWWTTFSEKAPNFVYFGLSDFVQISLASGKNIY